MADSSAERDELARTLKSVYGAIIAEADEWRPLAQHILSLIELSSKQASARIGNLEASLADEMGRADDLAKDKKDAWELIDGLWTTLKLLGCNPDACHMCCSWGECPISVVSDKRRETGGNNGNI